jgi:hypothetical protein
VFREKASNNNNILERAGNNSLHLLKRHRLPIRVQRESEQQQQHLGAGNSSLHLQKTYGQSNRVVVGRPLAVVANGRLAVPLWTSGQKTKTALLLDARV